MSSKILVYLVSRFLLVFFLVLHSGLSGKAQADHHLVTDDSSRIELLNTQSKLIGEFQGQRLADSIRMSNLEQQLKDVKSFELRKKRDLQQELENTRVRDSIQALNQRTRIDSLRRLEKGYPVVPFTKDTLYMIYSNIGSFSARERAASQVSKIIALAGDYQFYPDSLVVRSSEITSDVIYRDQIISSINDIDAVWEQTNRKDLAEKYRGIIAEAVVRYRLETSWKAILIKVGIALLTLGFLSTILYMIRRLYRFICRIIESYGATKFNGISINGYSLMDTSREIKTVIFFTGIIRWILVLVSMYFALFMIFSLFPWTKHISGILLRFFTEPLGTMIQAVIGYMPSLITIVVILFIFRLVIKGIRFLKTEIEKESLNIPGFHPDLANPTFQIIRVLVYAFMFVVIFPYLPGSESPVFKGVSVFLGVIFTLGSSGSLNNLVAGLVLTYMRSFKIGDRVRLGSETGNVIEKGILVTRIRTPKNEIISIPNSNALSSNLVNYSSEITDKGLIIHTTISIGYDTEWRQVYKMLLDAANETDLIEREPIPFVLQTKLDDFYVAYEINAYTKQPDRQAMIYSQLNEKIQDKFNEAGVQIMSPHYKDDKENIAIPEKYRSKK